MHGEPALGPDFERLPYAAPEGAGGGRMAIALQGTYDSLNPFIVLGVAPDAGPKYVWEKPDGALPRRAVHALRVGGARHPHAR